MTRAFLRDAIADETRWHKNVDRLRVELERATDAREKLSALGHLGDQLRLHPDHYSEALSTLRTAIRLADAHGSDTSRIGNRIRLATALQYAG